MKKTLITSLAVLLAFTNLSFASNYKHSNNQIEFSAYLKSPLHLAISKGDVESVRRFIKYGIDINRMSKDMTPLMVAARYNEIEIIKILLANGAKPFQKNERGYTALNYAEFSKAQDAIIILKSIK